MLRKRWVFVALLLSLVFAGVAVAVAGGWVFVQRKEYGVEPSFTVEESGGNYFDVWLDAALSVPLNPGLKFDFGTVERGQNVTEAVDLYVENTVGEDVLVNFVFVGLPQYLEGSVAVEGGDLVPIIPAGGVMKVTVSLTLCSGLYSTPIIPPTLKFQINAYKWIEPTCP